MPDNAWRAARDRWGWPSCIFVCVRACVQALAGRCSAALVIVYLPFHDQMALLRKNVLLDTLSLTLSTSLPPALLWLTPVYGLGFASRTFSMR